eukprot:ANDGO_06384.mRNA.1 Putative acid phosphatase 5
MKSPRCLLLHAVFILSVSVTFASLVVEHVAVVFRHGDRAPTALFPTDPGYADPSIRWPWGLGELTPIGMDMHYAVGQRIKERYNLSTYSPSLISVRSTDYHRTLMSAESDLLGVFFEKGPVETLPNRFQPVPISTVPQNEDALLLGYYYAQACPYLYENYLATLPTSPQMQAYNLRWRPLFDVLTNITQVYIDVDSSFVVADTFQCNLDHNYTQAAGVTPEIIAQTLQSQDEWFNIWFNPANPVFRQMASGLLINSTLSFEDSFVKVYSAHDITVATLLAGLGFNVSGQPAYASQLYIERLVEQTSSENSCRSNSGCRRNAHEHRSVPAGRADGNGFRGEWKNRGLGEFSRQKTSAPTSSPQNRWVRIFYADGWNQSPQELTLPGCSSSPCPYETVLSLLKPYSVGTIDEFVALCQFPNPPSSCSDSCGSKDDYKNVSIVVGVIGGTLIIVVIAVAVWLKKKPQAVSKDTEFGEYRSSLLRA